MSRSASPALPVVTAAAWVCSRADPQLWHLQPPPFLVTTPGLPCRRLRLDSTSQNREHCQHPKGGHPPQYFSISHVSTSSAEHLTIPSSINKGPNDPMSADVCRQMGPRSKLREKQFLQGKKLRFQNCCNITSTTC